MELRSANNEVEVKSDIGDIKCNREVEKTPPHLLSLSFYTSISDLELRYSVLAIQKPIRYCFFGPMMKKLLKSNLYGFAYYLKRVNMISIFCRVEII